MGEGTGTVGVGCVSRKVYENTWFFCAVKS